KYTQTVILLLILTFTGCNKYKEQRQIIDRAENLIESHPDSAYSLLKTIKAPDLMSGRLLARWALLAGKAADKNNEKMPAPFILEKAYNWQKRHGSHENQAWTGLYLARAYTENKKYNDATKIFTEAIHTATKAKTYNAAGYLYSYFGDLYQHTLQEDEEIRIREKATECFLKAGNKRSYALSFRDLARPWVLKDSINKSISLLKKANQYITSLNDSLGMESLANCLGTSYSLIGKYDSARYYLYKAMELDTSDIAPCYIALGEIYLNEGNLDSARYCAFKANKKSVNQFSPAGRLSLLSKIEKTAHNPEKALEYIEEYNDFVDSLYDEENEINVANAERQYNHVLLVNDNEKLKVRNLFFIVCFSISIIIALSIWLYFQNKDKKRIQKINEQQQLLGEQENKLNQLLRRLKESQQKEKETPSDPTLINHLMEEIEETKQIVENLRIEKIQKAPISDRIKKLLSRFPKDEHVLSEKDWKNIHNLIDNTFTYLPLLLEDEEFKFTPTEIMTCYISFFNLKPDEEAVLLDINIDTVNKRRFRLRQKLGIENSGITLFDYLKKEQQRSK
ncbi:MAG: tetratricopeptide repeat protein, partial [Parabacteroides sp.]|nr:tetratricopeptide repeat protein [Parabacteroides sp.]